MGAAKSIVLKAIPAAEANSLVKRVHYSGKIVQNSQLHIGVFYRGKLEGAMQFGPSLDKRKLQTLVEGTPWNGFIELNRMAFSEALPRNSESRAIGIAMKMLKAHASHLQWVVSFADAAQCGDGTIYRASGFVLTAIKRNDQVIRFPDGHTESRLVLTDARRPRRIEMAKRYNATIGGAASLLPFRAIGATAIPGFQLRYLYFLDPTVRQRLTVPILPFDAITKWGASMYRGKPRAGSAVSGTSGHQPEGGGATPTPALSSITDSSDLSNDGKTSCA